MGGPVMCHIFSAQSPKTYGSQTRSVRLGGHVTSIRLERVFWDILEETEASKKIEEAVMKVTPKLDSLSAGKMGYSTQEVGDLVVKEIVG